VSSSLQVAASEIRICLAAIGTVVRMGDVHEQGQTSYVTDETPMIKCGRDKTKRLLYNTSSLRLVEMFLFWCSLGEQLKTLRWHRTRR